jgi:hypothetical protein
MDNVVIDSYALVDAYGLVVFYLEMNKNLD